jgi:hypothetical protein
MMARFVAVVKDGNDKTETYVIDGATPVEDVFKFVNERRFAQETKAISIHVDRSEEEPFLERILSKPRVQA